jgi:hypothetical protein
VGGVQSGARDVDNCLSCYFSNFITSSCIKYAQQQKIEKKEKMNSIIANKSGLTQLLYRPINHQPIRGQD